MAEVTVAPYVGQYDPSNAKCAAYQIMRIMNDLAALGNELRTDHATFKTWADEIATDHAALITWMTEVDGDLDSINDYIAARNEADGVIGGDFTIASTAAATLLGAGHVRYQIGGQVFYIALDTTITLADDGDVDDTKWRAWRIEIDRTGTVTATADGDTQHANEEDALLNLSTVAPTANTVTIGYWTVHSNGGFDVGSANTNGETADNAYHVRGPQKQVSGLHTALGASIAVGTTPENFSHGTIDAMRNGVYLTQIAAGTDVAFDDADVITSSGQFGGHLVLVGLDGASVYALASDGLAGAVSTMTHASAAAANTALDTLADQIPEVFVIVGRIVVEAAKATFTYGTDDIAGTDGTATYTDATVGVWDRTSLTGFDSHQINPPAVPATVTAALLATLTASTPAALSAAASDTIRPINQASAP